MHFSGLSRCLSLDSQLRSIWRETRALEAPRGTRALAAQRRASVLGPALPLKPAVGLLVGGSDVALGTADALGVASGAGFSPKVNPLFVDVFPELVGEKLKQIFLGS